MWLTPPRVALVWRAAVTVAGVIAAQPPVHADDRRQAPRAPVEARAAPTSIREITLDPDRFADRKVTVIGQFRGRNLFADLSEEPAGAEDAFVLRAADAAIWITGVRPRGQGFNLDAASRADTGRWLRVTGTMRRGGALGWIEGASIDLVPPPSESAVEIALPALPPAPLEILFSAPTQGEADVRLNTRIRLQFSQDVNPASLPDRIRVLYSKSDSVERGEAQPPAVPFSFTYAPGNRALEIVPTGPLERFRDVTVELLDGIVGTRGERLKGWSLRFATGGS